MEHIPYGYRIENGQAVLDEKAAEQVSTLFRSYLAGDALATAAHKAGIEAFHSGITRILQNKRYLGDAYYPAIIDLNTFVATEAERVRRAEKLGRVWEPKEEKKVGFPTAFRLREGAEQFDDPFMQAEYTYSLIETEVLEDGC
jgi:hypothetical protein